MGRYLSTENIIASPSPTPTPTPSPSSPSTSSPPPPAPTGGTTLPPIPTRGEYLVRGAQAVVHVLASKNNTHLTLQDIHGAKKVGTSAGTAGYRKSRRSSPVGAADAAASLVQRARDLGIRRVAVKVKGVGGGRESALRALSGSGMRVVRGVDATPVPHNGCRPPKKRRI